MRLPGARVKSRMWSRMVFTAFSVSDEDEGILGGMGGPASPFRHRAGPGAGGLVCGPLMMCWLPMPVNERPPGHEPNTRRGSHKDNSGTKVISRSAPSSGMRKGQMARIKSATGTLPTLETT